MNIQKYRTIFIFILAQDDFNSLDQSFTKYMFAINILQSLQRFIFLNSFQITNNNHINCLSMLIVCFLLIFNLHHLILRLSRTAEN